jgi:hypothetical protein
MKTNKTLICVIIVSLCSISMSQENTYVPKPFLNTEELAKVPDIIDAGLRWPSDPEIANKRVSISSENENQSRKTISKCLNSSLYDPNKTPSLISLLNWPKKTDSNIPNSIVQYVKDEYIINIRYSIASIFIGIKRADGKDIWDLTRDHSEFVPWALNKFFVSQNVGPLVDKEMHYVQNEKGTKDFYYAYVHPDIDYFSPAYMWTNGKIIVLRVDQRYDEGKKRSGKKMEVEN